MKATIDATFHDLRREIVRIGVPFGSYEFCLTGSETVKREQEKSLTVWSTAYMHGNESGSRDDPYQVIIKERDDLIDADDFRWLLERDDLFDADDFRWLLDL